MNIFATGGTGFVGSHVVAEFSRLGHRTTVYTRRAGDSTLPTGQGVHYTSKFPDLSNFDMIYSMAGVLGDSKVPVEAYQNAHVDLPGKLVTAGNPFTPVIHLSTAYVNVPTSHKTYIETKRQSENILQDHFKKLSIVRPGPIFGPGDKHHFPLFKMVKQLGILCLIPGASNRLCPTHVADVAEQMMPDKVRIGANVISGEPVTIKVFMQEIARSLGVGIPFVKVPPIIKRDFFGVDRVFKTDIPTDRTYVETINDATVWYVSEGLL